MQIIIELKESATVGRINSFDIELRSLIEKYKDVMESIGTAW